MSHDIATRLGRETTLEQRQAGYAQIPSEVLLDLAEFCRANETTFHVDARAAAMFEGRRQVWLRIQEHLFLTPAQLMDLFQGKPLTK